MRSIIDFFESLSEMHPDTNWYFPDTGKNYSVADMFLLVKEYAAKFEKMGIKPQSSVGLILPNTIELVVSLYACWFKNVVAVPLRPKSGKFHDYSDFLLGCNNSCDFKLLICTDEVPDENLATWRSSTNLNIQRISDFLEVKIEQEATRIDVSESDMAIIQFSSGSTGFPKGVIVTHEMVIKQLEHLENPIRENQHNRPIKSNASWMPINHDLGIFSGVLMPIFCGSANVLATQEYYMRNPARWFQLLAMHKVELTFTTNAALSAALRSVKRLYGNEDSDLSNLNLYITAEKISAIVLRNARDKLSPLNLTEDRIHSAYGMAENTLGASISRSGQTQIVRIAVEDNKIIIVGEDNSESSELVSVGPPHVRHTFTIRDADDKELDDCYLGEINIESDCLTPGYLNLPDVTEEKLSGRRFRTGDLGFMMDGQLYFYGRKDDMIVYNGRNIVPEDIEETVESLPFVRDSSTAMLAWENERTGLMNLYLVVECVAADTPEERYEKELAIVNRVIEKHEVTFNKIYFCSKGTVEKTSSGKKRRKVVKGRLRNNQLEIFESHESLVLG